MASVVVNGWGHLVAVLRALDFPVPVSLHSEAKIVSKIYQV